MRDRLIELIKQATALHLDYLESIDQKGLTDTDGRAKFIADHLLANGIIVPPCKVGDKVYVVNTLFVSEYTINEMAYDNIFFRFYCANEDYAIECRSFMFFDERIAQGKSITNKEFFDELKKGGAEE